MKLGPTGQTVAANITRVRELRALNYTELSRKLTESGRAISPLAIRHIEEGTRRVDVDDLIVLASALDVPPIILLSPNVDLPDAKVEATGLGTLTATRLWDWLRAEKKLTEEETFKDWLDAQRAAPQWRLNQIYEGASKIIEINRAELDAREGDSSKLDRILSEHRKIDGND
ncbi:hypothetical protein GCM10009582_04530 [Arthrobacter flavus]